MDEINQLEASKIALTNAGRALARFTMEANARALSPGNAMFGPGVPVMPVWEEEQPRLFQYTPGVNLVLTPRVGYGLLPFSTLRALGQVKEVRLNIELIKRTMRGIEWDIVSMGKQIKHGDKTYTVVVDDEVRNFFECPDGVNDFDTWLSMLLEELLVTDALTMYPSVEDGRQIIEIIDGATIRPLVDMRGRVPHPPLPAYSQILYGVPTSMYTARQLMYCPLNTKVNTPYGESPSEWILATLNTSIRHELQRISYFTEGNIPGALVFLGDVTPEQAKIFDEYVNAITQGDIARAVRLLFLPGGGDKSVFPFQQNNVDVTNLDSWLMQVACWTFGNSPAEFGLVSGSQGLGGSGYMQASENTQYRSMIGPLTEFLASMFNRIIRRVLERNDVKFTWIGMEPPEDELKNAQVEQIRIGSGVWSVGYVQEKLGVPQEFRNQAQASAPMPSQAVGIPSALLPYMKRSLQSEFTAWKSKAIRRFEKGWQQEEFISDVIPADLRHAIGQAISQANSVAEIASLFDDLMGDDDRLQKTITQVIDDPSGPFKRTVESDLGAAIAEYFEGLKQRVISYAVAQ